MHHAIIQLEYPDQVVSLLIGRIEVAEDEIKMMEYTDDTATIKAAKANRELKLVVDVVYSGRTSIAPSESPKM